MSRLSGAVLLLLAVQSASAASNHHHAAPRKEVKRGGANQIVKRPHPAYAADCLPGQVTRPCVSFEPSNAEDGKSCLCPGYGNKKEFSLVVSNLEWKGLQPTPRTLIVANGTLPGPAIVVNQGDWLSVKVTNAMANTTTTIHWHGMLQVGTVDADGVPGFTQCMIPPGATVTYHFRASMAGTYWYHGHHHDQFVEGLYGPLIILPPPREVPLANAIAYKDDVTFSIMDYYSVPAPTLVSEYYLTPLSGGNEPIPDAILVNGEMTKQLGIRASRRQPMRLRFIAANAFSMWTISVDGCALQVVEVDGTAVEPYDVSSFTINVAQRVSVVVDFKDAPRHQNGAWLRISAMTDMYPVDITGYIPEYEDPATTVPLDPNYLAYFYFDDDSVEDKPATPPGFTPRGNNGAAPPNYDAPIPAPPHVLPAAETNMIDARPADHLVAPDATHNMFLEIEFGADDAGINRAYFNHISSPHALDIPVPVLYDYLLGNIPAVNITDLQPSTDLPNPILYDASGQYILPYGAVIEVLISNTDSGEHPIHFHGHQFWVVGSSEYPDTNRHRANYIRRDVVSIQAGGWVQIRFIADNPGIWITHCHIDWHLDAGLSITMIEAPDQLSRSHMVIPSDFKGECPPVHEHDSITTHLPVGWYKAGAPGTVPKNKNKKNKHAPHVMTQSTAAPMVHPGMTATTPLQPSLLSSLLGDGGSWTAPVSAMAVVVVVAVLLRNVANKWRGAAGAAPVVTQ